jgi:copper oxidase (laccase) domain-containing protein
LLNGVIESTVQAMRVRPNMAWLGAAIGPTAFEVGDEVRAAFMLHDPAAATAFLPSANGRWLANLYDLARMRLHALGIVQISGGDQCTVLDETRFYSFRREPRTGRMATVALIRPR